MKGKVMREILVGEFLPALHITTTTTGVGIDLKGQINPGGREMAAFINIGAKSGTTPTCNVTIEESDALGSGYTAITGAAFTEAVAETAETIYFRTKKRYVRMVATLAGTSPTFDLYGGLLSINRQT